MPIKKRRRRLDKEESNIVIVGSGLAGLSAAISLEQAGFSNVSIFERDDSFDRQKEGYGLTLTYNPKGPLASLGLLEQVANEDCPSRSHYLFRQDGSIMGYFGNTFSKHRGLGQRGNLRIPRKVLRRLLLEKLSSSKVHWGHTLMDYVWDPETNQYTLHFEKKNVDGIEESQMLAVTADLLVAADGIRSAVLKKLQVMSLTPPSDNPRVGLRSIGIRLILGIAEFSHPLLNERGFYTLDGKHRLFTMPFESNRFDAAKSNRIMWQLSLLTNKEDADQDDKENYSGKPLDPTALREYVLDTCDQWHDPVKEMVNSTPLSTIWGT
jgi:2-polyprenyl-6-methoxyphenol hydroxylase-like FAD-dependent oxidoreductase